MKSIGAAKLKNGGEPIDEWKLLSSTVTAVYGSNVHLIEALYSKELFVSLCCLPNAIDKSIRGDVHAIRQHLEN